MHVNDMFAKAIQQYADTVPNEVLKVNLLALAEHMGDRLVEILQLKQKFAVLTMDSYTRQDSDGNELPLMEEIAEVDIETEDYSVAYRQLEFKKKRLGGGVEGLSSRRLCIGGSLFTDWVEDVQPQVDPEMETALNLPGT